MPNDTIPQVTIDRYPPMPSLTATFSTRDQQTRDFQIHVQSLIENGFTLEQLIAAIVQTIVARAKAGDYNAGWSDGYRQAVEDNQP